MLARLIAEGRLGPVLGITCRGKTDGAGAQATATISAMAMARLAGCRYLHSPFSSMSHAKGTREDWARRWETFFNLGDGEAPVPEDAELVRLSAIERDPHAHAGRPIVIFERMFDLQNEAGTPIRDALRGELRAKYWRGQKSAIPSHRAPSGLTAAIHVRRGDVTVARHPERYVRDEAILRQIARVRRAVAPLGRPLTINLYSEGAAADFRAFADAGCVLHVSEDTFETFHNMVTADILMNAPSTFSHLAGMLSQGIVLDHRRRSPRFRNWIGRRANGDVPIKSLRRALLGRMSWLERCKYHAGRCWRLLSPARR